MSNLLYQSFRMQFLEIWKEYRVRKKLKPSDPKYWSKSVFIQKIKFNYLNLFGLKRITDAILLERIYILEQKLYHNSRVNSNLIYQTSINKQLQDLYSEFHHRINGESEYISLKKALKHAKIKI